MTVEHGSVCQEKHIRVSHLKSSETLGACRQGVISNHMGSTGREIL